MEIKIDKLKTISDQMNDYANDLYKLNKDLVNCINNLKSAWQGTSANSFIDTIENNYYPLIKDAAYETENYAYYLKGVAKTYQALKNSFESKNIKPGDLS